MDPVSHKVLKANDPNIGLLCFCTNPKVAKQYVSSVQHGAQQNNVTHTFHYICLWNHRNPQINHRNNRTHCPIQGCGGRMAPLDERVEGRYAINQMRSEFNKANQLPHAEAIIAALANNGQKGRGGRGGNQRRALVQRPAPARIVPRGGQRGGAPRGRGAIHQNQNQNGFGAMFGQMGRNQQGNGSSNANYYIMNATFNQSFF